MGGASDGAHEQEGLEGRYVCRATIVRGGVGCGMVGVRIHAKFAREGRYSDGRSTNKPGLGGDWLAGRVTRCISFDN